MAKPTLYCLMDTETTKKNGMVFDFAFTLLDKRGKIYESMSFVLTDVLMLEEPFYQKKIGQYWKLVYKQKAKPLTVKAVRRVFNRMLAKYLQQGYKIIICAYQAAFDISHMGQTSRQMCGLPFLTPETKGVKFFDLWHGWVVGCPVDYGNFAPWTRPNPGAWDEKKKRPVPANLSTTAENVYRYITGIHNFEEKHIAHSDVGIEIVILLDILQRKKKMHVVSNPADFKSHPWKLAQERCKVALDKRRAELGIKESPAIPTLTDEVPDLSDKKQGMQLEMVYFPEPETTEASTDAS